MKQFALHVVLQLLIIMLLSSTASPVIVLCSVTKHHCGVIVISTVPKKQAVAYL